MMHPQFKISVAAVLILISVTQSQSYAKSLQFKISIRENTRPNQPLIDLGEKLKTTKSNSRNSKYKIISGHKGLKNLVQLNERSGRLLLTAAIDREEICGANEVHCVNTLLISHGSQVIEVILEVLDVNDEAPTFRKPDAGPSVFEDVQPGTLIDLPIATDLDSPQLGIDQYYLHQTGGASGETLGRYLKLVTRVDPVTRTLLPYLEVVRALDRERVPKFSLVLGARDKKGKSGSVSIIVHVKDVNDNVPQWIGLPFHKTVPECTRDREIFHLRASDPDDENSVNSELDFSIDFARSQNARLLKRQFYVSGRAVVLIEGALKGLAASTVLVPVKVTDGGGLENTTLLNLTVTDCNDHAPQIDLSSRSGRLSENQHNSSTEILSFLTVTDHDLGANSLFSCLLNDTAFLSLRLITDRPLLGSGAGKGRIHYYQIETRTDRTFDRETMDRYSVTILCADKGTPVLRSSQNYNIIITDQNDNAPIFTKHSYFFSVRENLVSSSEVGIVSAPDKDIDQNGKVIYRLTGPDTMYFSVSNFGVILTKHHFDREMRDRYNFTVIAKDCGPEPKSASALVRVHILDSNDCKPTFQDTYRFEVVESYGKTTIHAELGTVIAVDRDLGRNSEVVYSVQTTMQPRRHNGRQLAPYSVQVSKAGKLMIHGIIDRETDSTIFVDIVASDRGSPPLTSMTTVTVSVLDLNDNKPKFLFPASGSYVNVSLDADAGGLITQLTAIDPDYDLNGTVHFQLIDNAASSPVIVESDGRVFLKDDLKSVKKEFSHSDRVLIRATDGNPDHPNSEICSLLLRYLQPPRYPSIYRPSNPTIKNYGDNNGEGSSNNDDESNSGNSNDYFMDNNESNSSKRSSMFSSNYIVILYCLAAVVFIVFLSVLCVLIYFYVNGKNSQAQSHRKTMSTKPVSSKLPTLNSHNDYFETIPFDSGVTGTLVTHPNSNNNLGTGTSAFTMTTDLYGLTNHNNINNKSTNDLHNSPDTLLENQYMQLMHNNSTGVYNPLSMFTTQSPNPLFSYYPPCTSTQQLNNKPVSSILKRKPTTDSGDPPNDPSSFSFSPHKTHHTLDDNIVSINSPESTQLTKNNNEKYVGSSFV